MTEQKPATQKPKVTVYSSTSSKRSLPLWGKVAAIGATAGIFGLWLIPVMIRTVRGPESVRQNQAVVDEFLAEREAADREAANRDSAERTQVERPSTTQLEATLAALDDNARNVVLYSRLLNTLETRCSQSRTRLIDMTVAASQEAQKLNPTIKNIDVLQFVQAATEPLETSDCTDIFVAGAIMLGGG